MKKKFILLMMLLAVVGGVSFNSLRAQETITIGSGTEVQSFLPLQANYDNTISEQIFLAEDFQGKTGSITSYAFKSAKDLVSYGTPITVTRNFKIYMINTDKASFASSTDWVNMTDANLVFNGSVTVQPKDTWTTITFDTPFEYENGKNVLLCIVAEGSWNALSGNYYKHATTNVRSLVYYVDTTPLDATNITVASKFDNLNYVAQAQFTFETSGEEPEQPTAPATPTNLVATATGETTIALTWNAVENATSYNVYSGTTTVATALTATTYTVENLTAGTEYCYNVTAVNANGESAATADVCATTNVAETPDDEAQEIVIGEATGSTNAAPFRTTSAYSWVEMLYHGSEIGQACTISSLSFNCVTSDSYGSAPVYGLNTNIKIYLAEVTKTDSYANTFVPEEDLTLVYEGTNITLGEEEWETFTLNTPFEYSGTNNLVIAISNNAGSNAQSIKWSSRTKANSVLFDFSDNNPAGAEYPNENGFTGGAGYAYNQLPIVKLGLGEGTTQEPEEGDFIVVGDENTTGSTSVAPFKNSNKYSWVETYYPKEELGQAMTITSLAYKCATVNSGNGYTLTADEIEIYLAETDNDNHSTSAVWVPQNELTLVYAGTNILLGEEEWESFTLDTPFEYSGTRNLAIVVSKSASTSNSAMKYASTTVDKVSNYRSNDNNTAFADYPAGNGTTNGNRPVVKIGYSGSVVPEVPATPANLVATATSSSTIDLTWDAVEGATEYNIYSGTETIATEVTTTSYNVTGLTAGTEYCYNVTAVNVAGESAPTTDACATPTEADQSEYALYDSFSDGNMDGWRTIDADGDGNNWKVSQGAGGIVGYDDYNCIYSESYTSSGAVTPNNYIVTTTSYNITEGSVLSWLVMPSNNYYCADHYAVVYSTDGEFFYTIWEETLTSTTEYAPRSLELDYIAGQTVYIGFRHYMCTDNEAVCIDNIALSLGESDEPVMANGDIWQDAIVVTEYPFAHTPDFANLNNNYTLPGEEQDGNDVVYKLTFAEETTFSASVTGANGKVALYAEGFNGEENPGSNNYYGAEDDDEPEQPTGATTFSYDFNDAQMTGWNTIDADGDGENWMVGYNYPVDDFTACLYSQSYTSTTLTPNNYVYTVDAYSILETSVLSYDVRLGNAFWSDEYYGVAVSENGTDFTTIFEESADGINTATPKTVDLSAYAGKNIHIAFRHFNCSGNEAIAIDNVVLSDGSKRNRANAIDNMTVPAGTYYLVASATEAFSVNINTVAEQESDLTPVAQVTATENGANVDVAWTMDRNLAVTDAKSGKSINLDETRDPSDYTFHSYNVYRVNGDNEPIVLAENLTETTYQDATWAEAEAGVYKWGVAAMYTANAKREEVTLINEGFEVGYYMLPEGWTTYSDPATANQYGNFNAYSSLYSDITSYAGAYSAFTLGGYAAAGSLFYLVTPALDFSSIVNPTINFHYVCPEFWGNVNTLSVKYGTSATGPWTDLWTGETTAEWLDVTIDLSECSGSTVYVAFCSEENASWGVGVDNVIVKGTQTDGPIPVASEIVWSNAIDKDMTTTVAVNVTTDDGGSVEGTTVRLENVNEPTYVYETTLDATGQYTWTDFRKGTYEVTIALEGYNSCANGEIMEIMDATTIDCTLELKPELVEGLYVSPTGWAMWEYVPSDFAGGTFEFDFETGNLMGWTNIDADGDGNVWFSNESSLGAIPGHDSDYSIVSQSYDNTAGPLTPDNYIVSPEKYAVVQGSEFSFYVAAQDANYAAEHFGVAISTTGNTSAADFTTIYEETLTAKSNGQKGPRDGGKASGNWYKHCVDLSAYAGQEVYIALRHFNCTDMFYIIADDFRLGFRTADNIYDVVFEGETVADDIAESFYQLDVTGLTEGEEYTTTVIVNNWTNQAMEYTWTYRACSNYAGVTNFAAVENDGNAVLTWTLPVYENQDPVYEFASNFDDGSLNGWNTIDADGDARNWQNTSEHANQGFGVNNTYCASSSSYDNSAGALTPDNYLVTDIKYTISEGSTLTYAVCGQSNTYYEEHYGVAVSTTNGTDAAAFTTIFEETLERGNVEQGSIQTQWFERTIDLSDYAGQAIYIAFRHFNCSDQWWINLDNVELSNPTRGEEGEWIYYDNGINESAFGFTDYNTGLPQTMYWAIMFPADIIADYAGTTITKLSMFVYEGHTGGVSIHTGGDYAPGALVHVQEYEVSSVGQYEEIELTSPVTISGTENVWIQFSNTSGLYVAAHSADCGDPNSRWLSNDGTTWYDNNWYGADWAGTWQIRAYVEGEADPIIPDDEPEQAEAEVLGVMLYRDGELLTETPLNAETYTDNGLATGEHEYEVRVVYGGDDASTYYAMSCPEETTVTIPLDCVAPENLYGEYTFNSEDSFGATLRWPYNGTTASDWLYYDDGMMIDGIGGPQTFYWGIMIPAELLTPYAGTFLTKVAMFDRVATTTTLQVYYGGTTAPETLVHTQECVFNGINDFAEIDLTSALPIDPSMNLWVVMLTNDGANAYPASCGNNTGDANGRWISMDGSTWEDVTAYGLNYTWLLRAYVSSTVKGDVSELNPIAVENNNIVNNDATFVAQNGGRGSALDHYNVYRSTTNGNYEVIAETTSGYYFDEINESGTYYYQVTAVYAENGLECESDPATAYENESQNYVVVDVTAIDENGIKGMMIYPNPTKDNLTITAENMTRITITNTLGQVIFDKEVSSDNEMINMAQYEAGVYTVRITTENGVAVERITVL